MFTPIDIQNKTFEVKFRGYSSDEVDDFMDLLGKDYETLYQENITLRDKVALLTNAVEQYEKMEKTLQDSIILAQSTGESIKANAEKKAEDMIKAAEEKVNGMIKEAQIEGADIVRQANSDLEKTKVQFSGMKTEVEGYKARIRGICTGLLEMLEKME